jgi:FkbM family methyltransferase
MGLGMFISTCRGIMQNPGVQPVSAMLRHAAWHGVRRWAPLPFDVPLTDHSRLSISRREEMNGCVALAWSQRLYDYHNMTFLRRLLAEEHVSTCLDIGANIGVYALLMSENESVTVHAFEPHPQTYATLQRMLEANGRKNVHAWRLALSDAPGELRFTDGDCSPVNHVAEDGAIRVTCETGAAFCGREHIVPDVIKIDTEGFETRVLQGFGDLLAGTRYIFAEMNASPEVMAATLPADVFDGPLYVDERRKILCRSRHNHEDAVFVNQIALPELAASGYRVDPR